MKKFIHELRFNQVHFNIHLVTFEIFGSDTEHFLHAQTTQNVKTLKNKEWKWATFLDHLGKIESYFWILKNDKNFVILAAPYFTSIIQDRFDKYVISEEVELINKGIKEISINLGPKSDVALGYHGSGLEESSVIVLDSIFNDDKILEATSEMIDLWWRISGLPSMKIQDFKSVLLNNTRLFELALDLKKGCYPGQETVSKINTHRGASFYPVLLRVEKELLSHLPKDIFIDDKKVGILNSVLKLEELTFYEAQILRDYRVKDLQFNVNIESHQMISTVQYYPYFDNNPQNKAKELYLEATVLYGKNQTEAALHLLDISLSLDPELSDAYEVYGVILTHLGRFDEAISMMENVLKVNPQSVMAHTNLSLILMKQGKIEEAEKHKGLATVASFAQFGQEAKIKKTNAEEIKKKNEELQRREKMFLEVLSIDEEDPMALFGLGEISFERGEFLKAQNFLEKVIHFDKNYSTAYLLLSKVYIKLSLKEKLVETLQNGIRISAQRGAMMPANEMQGMLNSLK